MAIYFYSTGDEFGEFSNFAAFPISLDEKLWPTTEHYFQAQKFEDAGYREKIRTANSPMISARLGRSRKVKLRRNWESIKIDVMRRGVQEKFDSYPELQEILLSTRDEPIVEDTTGDEFWGCGSRRTGKNWLGRILMEVREKLHERCRSGDADE